MKKVLNQFLPHIIIVIIFIVISTIYFYPVLSGKVLNQSDLNHAKGMSEELVKFEKKTGEQSLWTNSMFGGMPAYQIKGGNKYNVYNVIKKVLRLGLPYTTIAILFIYFLGFYILLISLKIDKWLSLIGSLAFGFSSYNIIIILVGHITKCYAIAYMAPVIAGFLFIYDKKYVMGALFTAVALGIQISTNHIQIVYYTGILIGLLLVYKFITSILEKQIKQFAIATGVVLIAVLFALLPNYIALQRAQEVAEYSIRGKRELSSKTKQNNDGLDKDYALSWSYGVGETFTLLIPNYKGGASDYLQNNKKVMSKVESEYKEWIGYSIQYWGPQTFTAGPIYLGSIIIFLFVLGLLIVKNKIKWWLLAGTIVSIFLSWGSHFSGLTDILFDYLPLYNKFRTVSMALVIASVTVPLLAILTLKEIIENPKIIKEKIYLFLIAFGLTGGLAFLFYLIPNINTLSFPNDLSDIKNQLLMQYPDAAEQIKSEINKAKLDLINVRAMIFKADAIRSFAFILYSAAIILFYVCFKKFKKVSLLIALTAAIVLDIWTVDTRYLGAKNFQTKSKVSKQFKPTLADKSILKDKDPNYRVLNLTNGVFSDGITPYFHKSIGGFHGAKLRRYQNVIEYYLSPYVQYFYQAFQEDNVDITNLTANMQVLNMLNAKYIIYSPEAPPAPNAYAYGNVWFVDDFLQVNSADEEIENLGKANLKRIAIVNTKTFEDYQLPKLGMSANDSGMIVLTSYKPNHLIYSSNSTREEFAVFSEIYYKDGWQAYIDNKKVEHINVNYLLRGVTIPKGKHRIEFKFEPQAFYTGKIIALSSSIIVILAIFGFLGKFLWDKYKTGNLFSKEEEKIDGKKKIGKKKKRK